MPSIQVINHTNNMKRRSGKIQYIILHYSASTQSRNGSAMGTVRTLDERGYSSDFAVDDENIIQFAPDPALWQSTAVQSWSQKGTDAGRNAKNANAVSIEMSSTLDKGGEWEANDPHFRFTQQVLENTAYLCKMLIAKYNIPKQNVIRHYDIMGKCCPGIIGWNRGHGSNNENEYIKFVNSLYSGGTYVPPEPNYEYVSYASTGGSSSKGSGSSSSNNGELVNIPGLSNNVGKLASVSRRNENILKQDEQRKEQFNSLVTAMANNAPMMGRDILITSELYDSNILKGDQESKKERV